MLLKNTAILALISYTMLACSAPQQEPTAPVEKTIENPTNQVVLSSEIVWEQLNPARGDQSPQAGTVFGDRKGEVPTGFLAKFVDGFSSPPHIHNVSYRAVVIKGLIHNDDPEAENQWMQPGSFWTQPLGAVHITSAKGVENIAYVEIDQGPYLVMPPEEAFASEEQPVNIDASNVIWLTHEKTNWIAPNTKAAISFLWEDDQKQGLFVKLPAGFSGKIHSTGDLFRAIVIAGAMNYTLPQNAEVKLLDSGSYFTASSEAEHTLASASQEEVIIYVQTNGSLQVE